MRKLVNGLVAGLVMSSVGTLAQAADLVKVASSHKGFVDTTIVLLGEQKGIFAKHGIELNIVWTRGGSDTQQAVASGAVNVGIATGMLGVLSAFDKGAPISVISADMTGSSDLFWYVKADSPLKSLKDAAGKSMSFSRPGSSTDLVGAALAKASGVDIKRTATGGPSGTLTQVMTGQIDIGWSAAPIMIDKLESGEIRIIARGNDAPGVADQTVRVNVANSEWLKANTDLAKRFMKALNESTKQFYADESVLKMYAEVAKITMPVAKRARDEFFSLDALAHTPIRGLDVSIKEAVDAKRIADPLTDAEKKAFVSWVEKLN